MAEKEYIEREAALQFVFDACSECMDACEEFDGIYADCNQCMLEGVKLKLRDLPAADVRPVVLCRDCKHNKGKKIWVDGDETFDCTNGHGYPPLDWFCADGEKREES